MKTPSFWYNKQKETLWHKLLIPISAVYNAGHWVHKNILRNTKNVNIPVICIGNIVAGGAGKTPTALTIMNLIQNDPTKRFQAPYFLTRGYKSKGKRARKVDLQNDAYMNVGDEPLILASKAPTIVSSDRYEGATAAKNDGADILLMDDGLQNYQIDKNIKIVVVDGSMGFGNKKTLPAGPLRESLKDALKNVDLCILIGYDRMQAKKDIPDHIPVFEASFKIADDRIPDKDKKYLAFAGLGYPQKFFDYCRDEIGLNIVKTIPFPDHHAYSKDDLTALKNQANELKSFLLTTEKDMMRLKNFPEHETIEVLPVELCIDNETKLLELIYNKLENTSS